MAYADYTFYVNVYCGSMSGYDFEDWGEKASLQIDRTPGPRTGLWLRKP